MIGIKNTHTEKYGEILPERVLSYLKDTHIPLEIKKYGTVGSANTVAKTLAEDGAGEWTVVTAEGQTNGYGRVGRKFFSPVGTGIYISVVLRPDIAPEKLTNITTAAALSVCEAIEGVLKLNPEIKWVNDVFYNGRKVCGILTETKFSGNDLQYTVLGIGINLYKPKNGFDVHIRDTAGYLCERVKRDLKNHLTAEVIRSFSRYYADIGNSAHLDGYRKRMFLCGKTVGVTANGETKQAKVIGLTDNFGLFVVFDDGKEEILDSGEVSITL